MRGRGKGFGKKKKKEREREREREGVMERRGGESRKRGKEGIWFRIDVEGTACAKKKIIIIKEEILSVPVITHVFLVRGYCIFRLLS